MNRLPVAMRALLPLVLIAQSFVADQALCAPIKKQSKGSAASTKKVKPISTPKPTPAPTAAPVAEKQANTEASADLFNNPNFNNDPTFVKADSLTLKTDQRVFTYAGNVEVKHGDMTLTSESLEGNYDENNKIQRMAARRNVVILKGENMRGTAELATYEAAKDTVVLTGSPELTQNESILSADVITIFLKENRSEASGQVRVKLVSKGTAAPQ